MKEGTVFTFYSYKGGVGRTLALANIAALLSRWGYKVLCVDWDLEAPGLNLYFRQWMSRKNARGLTELIQDYVDGKDPKWRRYTTPVRFPRMKQPLLLMTAGLQNESYVQRMQALDWARLYDKHDLGTFIEELRENWKKAFDFILIDSRTGITDIGGICTVQLPDQLVILFTANEQSLYGSISVVERARQARNSLPFDRAKMLVLPVPSRFEVRVEYKEAQKWLSTFAKELTPLYAEWSHKDVTPSDLLNHTRIPSIPYWSFGERLPVIEKGTEDPEDIGYALETLAAIVAQRFSYSDMLVKNRDSYVAAVRKGPVTEAGTTDAIRSAPRTKPARVFISYSHKDMPLFDELKKHLSVLIRQGVIEMWNDRQIPAGVKWDSEINLYEEEADIILLLVSADYLASTYVYDVELPRLLKRQAAGRAVIIPIILRPVDWQSSLLSNFQVLPRDGKPITIWVDRDEAWVQVAKEIRAATRQLAPVRSQRSK